MFNIAVIGAGIGGCSAAYFAHKLLPNSKVTVYERGTRIGGRATTFRSGHVNHELGAAFFNSNNLIVSNLVRELGLEVQQLKDVNDIAVWNGTEVVFRSNHKLFYSMLKLVGKYGFSVPKLLLSLRKASNSVKKLYEHKEPTEFCSLFESLGLDKWYKRSFDEILVELGVDQKFIDELITPITRIIYSQNAELGGFAGLSALLNVYGESIYSLKDGNEVLPQKLVEASAADVRLDAKVDVVKKTENNGFLVCVGEQSSPFDAVIVATPLEVADMTFEGVSPRILQREYQKIYIQVMKGVVKPSYFNLDSSASLPSIVLTSKEVDPVTRFSIKDVPKGESWVTVTSTQPIGDSLCNEIFKNGTTVLDHTWTAAYPCFKPVKRIPDAFLDDGLVYLNAIESAASSLESSAFAALTAVNRLKQQISS